MLTELEWDWQIDIYYVIVYLFIFETLTRDNETQSRPRRDV